MPEHLSIPMDTLQVPRTSTEGARERDTQNVGNQQHGLLARTPTPIYRHAAPSGPWPWMDFDEDIPAVKVPSRPASSSAQVWEGYPQTSFPNWTDSQVKRCEMLTACPTGESTVLKVDVLRDGTFGDALPKMALIKDKPSQDAFWDLLKRPRDKDIRVRALFVKHMTKEVLQMLGTKYNIEPFFFSSSTNWIPSRYQENPISEQSDHITVVLPFIRAVKWSAVGPASSHARSREPGPSASSPEDPQVIDTQSPLYLEFCQKYILQDLVSVHMVRGVQTSTIISYHPKSRISTADQLHSLINRTGRSVYWSKIFEKSRDPTSLFLCFLWYAMYEWDEVFEILYAHINHLGQLVLDNEKIRETRELHILQAHLLYYRTLLEDFRKSVQFVQDTENPAMQHQSVSKEERAESKRILKRETDYLISEIKRLEDQRAMQVMRLRNIIDLAFATVNIDDSRYMKDLTVATVRDSAAMKQISYLTMIFLPANFMANVFSMNVTEINPGTGETLTHYIEAAISLTIFAAWVIVALQPESSFVPQGSPFWKRVGWPLYYIWESCREMYRRKLEKKITK